MKVLVTGGSGFLGQHLCRRLVKDNHKVSVLCRPTSNINPLADLKVEKIVGDITDAQAVGRAILGHDFVFHTAANLSYWGRQKDIQNKINVQGTKNVVEACLQSGVQKLVHVSSAVAIGIPKNSEQPADENFDFNLENESLNYHISKKCAEDLVRDAVNNGLNAVIVNPSSIWGPENEKKYRGAEFLQKVLQGKFTSYFTGGICVAHVEDVVEGIVAAFAKGKSGERYILGGDNLTFKSIAEQTVREKKLKRVFVPVPPVVTWLSAAVSESAALVTRRRPRITFVTHYGASKFYYYDSSKAKNELGYSPRNFKAIFDECISFIERNEKRIFSRNSD
jgi:dihydroflavonol-4-reductase